MNFGQLFFKPSAAHTGNLKTVTRRRPKTRILYTPIGDLSSNKYYVNMKLNLRECEMTVTQSLSIELF